MYCLLNKLFATVLHELIALSNLSINVSKSYPEGLVLVCHSGEVVILYLEKELLYSGLAINTIRQIWDFEYEKYHELSADYPLCGHRFAPPDSVIGTIENITKKTGLGPEQSPCFELPAEAWEEHGLLGNCPKCGGELKFNPFIAGEDN